MEQKFDNAILVAKQRILATNNPDETPKATQARVNIAQAYAIYKSLRDTKDIEKELEHLLGRMRANLAPLELMKASQAVLNLMHAAVASQPAQKTKTT